MADPAGKVRVLVVDDSAVVRQCLTEVLRSDRRIEVVGTAADPYVAVERIRASEPDVITLDIEMPKMDGLTFLERLMGQHPIPVVICSTLAESGSETALLALERGAVDIIAKPKMGAAEYLRESVTLICDSVVAAGQSRGSLAVRHRPLQVQPKLTADAVLPQANPALPIATTDKIVVVGASTGGTEALREFLEAMPAAGPGVVIVQHMPEKFTASFADRLNRLCRAEVKEAADGVAVTRGLVLIAPGNRHTLLKRSGARYFVEVREGPLVSRHRPSVDVLFRSAARYAGRNAVGVIMTGMGDDGASGMAELKASGAYTIAQDESSCVVFGMPAEAIKRGAVARVLPLSRIADEVVRVCGS